MMGWYGIGWTFSLFLAPRLIAGMVFIALGVGVVLAALNVAYRDFRYVIPFMVQSGRLRPRDEGSCSRSGTRRASLLWQYRELFRVSGLA